jgi:hypothetical protein
MGDGIGVLIDRIVVSGGLLHRWRGQSARCGGSFDLTSIPIGGLEWRTTAGENRAPTPFMAGDGGVGRRYLVECIAIAVSVHSCVLLLGESIDLGVPDLTMEALPVSLSFMRALFLGEDVRWWMYEVE